LEANSDAALETLSLQAAYCMSYEEVFVVGDATIGAYQCALVLSNPTGFTMQAGGSASAFVAATRAFTSAIGQVVIWFGEV